MPKPSSRPLWTVGNPSFGTVTIEPTGGKKLTGFTSGERPAFQTMNWLIYNLDQWIEYFDAVFPGIYHAIVGAGAGASHATLAAALADVAVPAGARILIQDSATVNATIQVTKNNVQLEFMPGVTYSKGSATTGLQISADGVRIMGGRFAAYSGGSDKAILIDAGSDYTMIRDIRFANCTTEVDDLASTTSILGTITE